MPQDKALRNELDEHDDNYGGAAAISAHAPLSAECGPACSLTITYPYLPLLPLSGPHCPHCPKRLFDCSAVCYQRPRSAERGVLLLGRHCS